VRLLARANDLAGFIDQTFLLLNEEESASFVITVTEPEEKGRNWPSFGKLIQCLLLLKFLDVFDTILFFMLFAVSHDRGAQVLGHEARAGNLRT